jgi:hypothetical protein
MIIAVSHNTVAPYTNHATRERRQLQTTGKGLIAALGTSEAIPSTTLDPIGRRDPGL